jgi:hypothetical protein
LKTIWGDDENNSVAQLGIFLVVEIVLTKKKMLLKTNVDV